MTVLPVTHTLKIGAYKKAVNGFIPASVVIPLYLEEAGDEECQCVVEKGQHVEEGQLIGIYENKDFKYGGKIYSPIPGTVEGIELVIRPRGKTVKGVKIRLQGSFSYLGKKIKENNTSYFTPSQLISEISEKGIVNSFVINEPECLAEQLDKAHLNNKKILCIRMFDEEPSRLTDSLISKFYFEEVCAGAEIAAKAMDADGILFVVDKKYSDFEKLKQHDFKFPIELLQVNQKKYPCTFVKELCSAARKSLKGTLFADLNEKDVFTDSYTMNNLFRCLQKDMPLIDNYIQVGGDCIPAHGMVKVALGTTLRSLAEQCGGFLNQPAAIIVNGMFNGVAATTLDSPVTKYVKSVMFIPSLQSPDQRQSVCIRCGNCRRVCPRNLSPDIIYRHITGGLATSQDYLDSSTMCVNCGLCNSVCPARLPLSQRIYDYKKETMGVKNV